MSISHCGDSSMERHCFDAVDAGNVKHCKEGNDQAFAVMFAVRGSRLKGNCVKCDSTNTLSCLLPLSSGFMRPF